MFDDNRVSAAIGSQPALMRQIAGAVGIDPDKLKGSGRGNTEAQVRSVVEQQQRTAGEAL